MVALGERATPNGQELLAEFIQYGHQKPFEEIVRRYAGMVFNVCFRITKDKHEAEDAVQAVFLTLALQAKRGTEIKALGPWLQQVAKRLALDIRRSKKRRKTREERHHAEQTVRQESILGDALPSADLDELKTALHEELQKLPAKYRMPLILHYFGGLTRDEMASELNCKASTLGVRIFRGREMLAGRLSGRGIHISGVALAALLGYAVKRAVSDTLIASTSYAATAMMAGHDGSTVASAHIMGLTRRATNAVMFTKVKVAAMTLLLAGSSLGAGAKALQMLPNLNVQQILSTQLNRLMRPLMQPFSRPLLSQAPVESANSTSTTQARSSYIPPVILTGNLPTKSVDLRLVTPSQPATVDAPVVIASANTNSTPAVKSGWTPPAYHATVATPVAGSSDNPQASTAAVVADDSTSSTSSASAGGGGGGAGGASGGYAGASRSSVAGTTQSHYGNAIIATNDLIIGGSGSATLASNKITATPTAIIAVPAVGGTVTETNTGLLRGWGTIQKTGTLLNNGQVVADGSGVDRTLNLTAFSAIQTAGVSVGSSTASINATSVVNADVQTDASTTAPATKDALTLGAINPPTRGWYAVNHGRLCLGLKPAATDSSVLTWGSDPNASVLTLTNSVRLSLKSSAALSTLDTTANAADASTLQLALLAPDRNDAPHLSEITGTPIGLWKVDADQGSITSADISICYDSLLANALGATQDSVALWTMNASTDSWSQVDPGSFALDTADHLVYGSADDFSYFAVTATAAAGADIQFVRAHQLAAINDPSISVATAQSFGSVNSSSVQSVPEPLGLPLLAMTAGLLGRRRRGDRLRNRA